MTNFKIESVYNEMLFANKKSEIIANKIENILKSIKNRLTSDDTVLIKKIKNITDNIKIMNVIADISNLPDNNKNDKLTSKLESLINEL